MKALLDLIISGGKRSIWQLSSEEHVWQRPAANYSRRALLPLVAMIRVRNEELIIADTLEHLASFSDLIVAYDDASTDNTLSILKSHPKVALIIENHRWLTTIEERQLAETRHRGLLLQETRARWNFRWCLCADADERYVGQIRALVTENATNSTPYGIRIQLFDAYLTPDDKTPYNSGSTLLNSRQWFGPERRDILMLWRNSDSVEFRGLDAREPKVTGLIETRFFCQHYGKSLSVAHWESTCDYYITHFPYEPYGRKWKARKGKAIHSESDFGRPLFRWGENLFSNSTTIF